MSGSEGTDGDNLPEAGPIDAAGDVLREGAESLEGMAGSLKDKLAAKARDMAATAHERVEGLGEDADELVSRLPGAFGAAAPVADGAFRFGSDSADQGEADPAIAAGAAAVAAGAHRLDLNENDQLPWLESVDDDDYEDGGVDTRRVAIFVIAGLALLAAIIGGIWWSTHRNTGNERIADGSVIAPPPGPYKTAPENPGGKTYDGTGDSSYAVSQGKNPAARLAASEEPAAAASTSATTGGPVKTAEQAGAVAMAAARAAGGAAAGNAAMAAKPASAPATDAGGIGVQVGAYTSLASAEAGWSKLATQYPPLSGMRHRIVQGQADIGTVYRLQAVPGGEAAANALCSAMRAERLACQVKR